MICLHSLVYAVSVHFLSVDSVIFLIVFLCECDNRKQLIWWMGEVDWDEDVRGEEGMETGVCAAQYIIVIEGMVEREEEDGGESSTQ